MVVGREAGGGCEDGYGGAAFGKVIAVLVKSKKRTNYFSNMSHSLRVNIVCLCRTVYAYV